MKILRRSEVVERCGYSAVHLRRLERDGKFPTRVALGPNAVGWYEHEIEEWLRSRPRKWAHAVATAEGGEE